MYGMVHCRKTQNLSQKSQVSGNIRYLDGKPLEISAFAESCGFGETVHCKPLPTQEGFGFDKHICREHLPAQEGLGSDSD
jgi:hypothetical protein